MPRKAMALKYKYIYCILSSRYYCSITLVFVPHWGYIYCILSSSIRSTTSASARGWRSFELFFFFFGVDLLSERDWPHYRLYNIIHYFCVLEAPMPIDNLSATAFCPPWGAPRVLAPQRCPIRKHRFPACCKLVCWELLWPCCFNILLLVVYFFAPEFLRIGAGRSPLPCSWWSPVRGFVDSGSVLGGKRWWSISWYGESSTRRVSHPFEGGSGSRCVLLFLELFLFIGIQRQQRKREAQSIWRRLHNQCIINNQKCQCKESMSYEPHVQQEGIYIYSL